MSTAGADHRPARPLHPVRRLQACCSLAVGEREPDDPGRPAAGTKADVRNEALAAMLALGYSRVAAEKAIRSALS